ncbi:RusA family crossover junction endodeoxyribonuclease [Reyranella sp.]|uniref:RusA family crossover junction endodeoxyribonuclease n=1 Tax=Reyranella sp. TaxID=1929291 RepID=UPI004035BCF8
MTAHRVISTPLDGAAVRDGRLTLSSPPPSLNNAFVNGKRGRFKSATYKAWLSLAHGDLRNHPSWHVPGTIRVRIVYSRAETGADLDNLIKPVLDLLVAAGRISDDRNVAKIEAGFDPAIQGVLVLVDRWAAEQARAAA